MFTATEQILIALFAALIAMLILWIVQRRHGNSGIVDVAWSAGLGLTALFYALTSDGLAVRRLLLAIVAGGWSFRLAFYLLHNRVIQSEEDGRYTRLRDQWGPRFQFNLFLFYEFQALLVVVFSIPFFMVARNSHPELTLFDLVGALIAVVSVLGESIADRQLARFRSDPANRGETCNQGLWRYSRHPNYFFEWLHWWSYVALGVRASLWWPTLLGPLLMLVFLYKITGIPTTEEQALASRGASYKRYQETTSQFFPWFPKEKRK